MKMKKEKEKCILAVALYAQGLLELVGSSSSQPIDTKKFE